MTLPLRGHTPQLGANTFIAPSAEIIGDVILEDECSVWFKATLRGDVMPIRIGKRSNIQDHCVIHGTFGKYGVEIGEDVTVGHSVILHGCTIGNLVLVGMGSIIMDNAWIPSQSIIGAGSLITENAKFSEGKLIMGRPAREIRDLTPQELEFLPKSAQNYLNYKKWYGEKA